RERPVTRMAGRKKARALATILSQTWRMRPLRSPCRNRRGGTGHRENAMNHRKTLLAAMLGTASLYAASASAAEAEKLVFADNPIEGRYIVVLKDEVVRFAGERSDKPEIAAVANHFARAYGVK